MNHNVDKRRRKFFRLGFIDLQSRILSRSPSHICLVTLTSGWAPDQGTKARGQDERHSRRQTGLEGSGGRGGRGWYRTSFRIGRQLDLGAPSWISDIETYFNQVEDRTMRGQSSTASLVPFRFHQIPTAVAQWLSCWPSSYHIDRIHALRNLLRLLLIPRSMIDRGTVWQGTSCTKSFSPVLFASQSRLMQPSRHINQPSPPVGTRFSRPCQLRDMMSQRCVRHSNRVRTGGQLLTDGRRQLRLSHTGTPFARYYGGPQSHGL